MDNKILIEIEEYLNSRFSNVPVDISGNLCCGKAAFNFMPDNSFYEELNKRIKKNSDKISEEPELYFAILEHIKKLDRPDFYFKSGDKKGELNKAKFCRYSDVDDSTMYNICWNIKKPSKETLLKLIVALKLNEKDAIDLMEKGSNAFFENDFRDQLMLALINCKEWEKMDYIDVYDIMEKFRNDGLPAHRFDNIYDSPAERQKKRKSDK